MPTVTDIANQALSRLGEPRISSIEENSPNAIVCRQHYETVRDALLRSHQWNFAADRAELSRLDEAPSFGWAYAYQLPEGCLRLNTLNGAEARSVQNTFVIEGDKLLTDSGKAQVTFVRLVEDPTKFDAIFTETLALRLAAAIAMEVTGSPERQAHMEQLAAMRLADANFADANETKPRVLSPLSMSPGIGSRGAPGLLMSGSAPYGPAPGPDGDPACKGTPGTDGWTPSYAVVQHAERRVLQITGWHGGTGDAPESGFLGVGGIVSTPEAAVDVRGPVGTGWSPILSAVVDGERRVFRVDDWTGGEGAKPQTGLYVGASGLTPDIGLALDVRGPSGSGDLTGPGVSVADGNLVAWDGTAGTHVKDGGVAAADMANLADNITVAAPVDLGSLASDAAGSKAVTDHISVTAPVDLDALASDAAAAKGKTDHLTVTAATDLDFIRNRVNDLDAAVVLRGGWDASGGSFPGSGTAQAGDSWIVTTGGTVDGVDFTANDRIIAILDNASTATYAANWLKADYSDVVTSVAGKQGAVTLVPADIGVAASPRIIARKTAGAGAGEEATLSEVLDMVGSAASGDILFRGASAWERLAKSADNGGFLSLLGGLPAWDQIAMFIAVDVKSQNTAGGAASAATWHKRDLNSINMQHPVGTATLSSNEVTVGPGVWLFQWEAPAYAVNLHKTRLWNVTDSTSLSYGSIERANSSQSNLTWSRGWCLAVFDDPKTLFIEHYTVSARATDGLGPPLNLSGIDEYYASLMGIRFCAPP